jgi:very-short-patch-repair endonuclease
VLNTIEAFPNGRSTSELYALLDVDFDVQKRAAIRAELDELGQQGVIRLGRDGKWRLVSRLARPRDPGSPDRPVVVPLDQDGLIAVPARFHVVASVVEESLSETESNEKPDPQALLRYYRAAIRSDPRGALTQTHDTYGTAHVLLCGAGSLWASEDGERGEIRIRLEDLPDRFREALKRRDANENALAIGWPISVGDQRGIPVIRPVGLVAGEWERVEDMLVIGIPHGDILVNPDWVKASARGTAWRASDLTAVFRATEGVGLSKDEFTERLREAQASAIRGQLTGTQFSAQVDPAQTGIHDALGLFLPTETTFTSGAVRDLDQIATWTPDQLSETALAPLLGLESAVEPPNHAPINVGLINAEQYDAVKSAMSRPLTVVTGPPGTGKSQAIVAMATTALQAGETILVASKNHQALDAVEERLTGIAPETTFLVRTLDPSRDIDKSIKSVLTEIVTDGGAASAITDPFLAAELSELAQQRLEALGVLARRRRLNLELADLIERHDLRAEGPNSAPESASAARVFWWMRLLRLLGLFRGASPAGTSPATEQHLSRRELEAMITQRRNELDALEEPADAYALTVRIAELARSVVARTLAERSAIDTETLRSLRAIRDDLELQGTDELPRHAIERVICARSLWLASVLGTPRRVPLKQGLFDLVIFDEASQCDIGTALPLLARARRAVVVGDDRQLAFISQISAAQDRNLMAAQGLPKSGMGRFAQGRKSLFDFASSTPGAQRVMLRDQYRSAPDIVDYISSTFYGGKLRVSADPDGFRVPRKSKPGLSWTHVPGQSDSMRLGNINRAEISEITGHLRKLLIAQEYDGSVGVITPFRAQVLALEQALKASLPETTFENVELRIATVDGFQGQERDLILFSLVVHAASPSSAVTFIQRDWRRLNVAISRARAVCHIFGDLNFARSRKIRSLATLAARATEPKAASGGETVFDSKWERIVYHSLRERGLDPIPQHEIAGRRLDFALFSGDIKLDLEIDGRRWHQDIDGNRKADDIWRDQQMKALGWRVRRFWVDELSRDLEGCLDLVQRDLS